MTTSHTVQESDPEETEEESEGVPFTDSYDIASKHFKSMVDEHVSNLTRKRSRKRKQRETRGQNKNNLWYEKRKTLLTASNFGKVAKTKVELSNKVKSILYSVWHQERTESSKPYTCTREMTKNGIDVKVEEIGLLVSKEKPFLGASIDRIVTFKKTEEKWGMEIKSPLSKAGMTVKEVCKKT